MPSFLYFLCVVCNIAVIIDMNEHIPSRTAIFLTLMPFLSTPYILSHFFRLAKLLYRTIPRGLKSWCPHVSNQQKPLLPWERRKKPAGSSHAGRGKPISERIKKFSWENSQTNPHQKTWVTIEGDTDSWTSRFDEVYHWNICWNWRFFKVPPTAQQCCCCYYLHFQHVLFLRPHNSVVPRAFGRNERIRAWYHFRSWSQLCRGIIAANMCATHKFLSPQILRTYELGRIVYSFFCLTVYVCVCVWVCMQRIHKKHKHMLHISRDSWLFWARLETHTFSV